MTFLTTKMFVPPKIEKFANYNKYLEEFSKYCCFYAVEELKNKHKPIGEKQIQNVLNMGGNIAIWQMFCVIIDNYKITKKAYNNALKRAYIMGSAQSFFSIKENRIITPKDLFLSADKFCIMSKKELELWNKLPDMVTIYRGTSESEFLNKQFGLSWSTDIKIAEFFAFRYTIKKRVLLKATIKKNHIMAVFMERNESEIIVNFNELQKIKILSRQPNF